MGTIASIISHFQLIPLAFDIIARFENSHNLLYFKKKKDGSRERDLESKQVRFNEATQLRFHVLCFFFLQS